MDGEGAADAAELEAFEVYTPKGEEVAESVFPEAKGGSDPGGEPLGESAPAVGFLVMARFAWMATGVLGMEPGRRFTLAYPAAARVKRAPIPMSILPDRRG